MSDHLVKILSQTKMDVEQVVSERDNYKSLYENAAMELNSMKALYTQACNRIDRLEREKDYYLRVASTLTAKFGDTVTLLVKAMTDARALMGCARPDTHEFTSDEVEQVERVVRGIAKINSD